MSAKRALLSWMLPAFALAGALQLFFVLRVNGGRLVYVLDDAYIHLRVSELIARGGYGINPGVIDAPASSILWPFLLAPLSGSSLHLWAPLLFCALASAGTLVAVADAWDRLIPAALPHRERRLAWAVALTGISAGVLVLPWTGMEHSLQCLTAVLVLRGMIREWKGESPGALFSLGIVAGSLIRYESALLSIVLLAVLFMRGRRRFALAHLAVVGALLCGASLILKLHTDAWLPSSVLVKKARSNFALATLAGRVNPLVERITLLVAASLLMAGCTRRLKGSCMEATGWILAALCVLNALSAPLHSYQRYDAYLIAPAFCIGGVILFAPEAGNLRGRLRSTLAQGLLVLSVVFAFKGSFQAIIVPFGAHEIYRQQMQMASFVQSTLKTSSAANDIGALSYGNRHFVLDLFGLASREARIAYDRREPGWMSRLAAEHRVPVALIYEEWFPGMVPCHWQRVGTLRIRDDITFSVGGRRVSILSTRPESAAWLHERLKAHMAAHPGTDFELEQEPWPRLNPCDAAPAPSTGG